jgi:hypothetical protein
LIKCFIPIPSDAVTLSKSFTALNAGADLLSHFDNIKTATIQSLPAAPRLLFKEVSKAALE